jgi:hypothetical protein
MRMDVGAEDEADNGVAWGVMHPDMTLVGRTVTAHNVSACTALLSRSLFEKGRMQARPKSCSVLSHPVWSYLILS